MPNLSLAKLNELYDDAETIDKRVHAEMRNNVLLVAGEHYTKIHEKHNQRRKGAAPESRVRITKNHSGKIVRRYVTAIMDYVGKVTIGPQLDKEMQDVKDAEINQAVYNDIIRESKLEAKWRKWAQSFVTTGEVCTFASWNPEAGELSGYEPLVDEETGQPFMDPMTGEMLPDEEAPVWSGKVEVEQWHGYDVFRASDAEDMDGSWFIGHRKLVKRKSLMKSYEGDEDKMATIAKSGNDDGDWVTFNASRNRYEATKDMVLLKRIFIRPSEEYRQGYFYYFTSGGILEEGELPFGLWPIVQKNFDEFDNSPRGKGLPKVLRPYNAEINRAASAQVMHQITIGDDKILYQQGTKLNPGKLLPGIRGLTYTGYEPKILPGRDGSQFDPYIKGQIQEMYSVSDVEAIDDEKQQQGFDAYAMLYREAKQRQKHSDYTVKFKEFKEEFVELLLDIARHYYDDDRIVSAVGRKEQVNIEEFRRTGPMRYKVKVESQDETLETKFGRTLTMQQILQYTGSNLSREDIGMLIRTAPYGNWEAQFSDMTVDYDNVQNTMLALERGDYTPTDPNENHDYMVKHLSRRMKESDFKHLDPQIQQMYAQKKQEHLQFIQKQQQDAINLKNQFIPIDGPLVGVDVYVQNPEDPSKAPKRARIPQRAIEKLMEILDSQGASIDKLEEMDMQTKSQLAQQMQGGMGPGMGGMGPGMPPGMPMGSPPGQSQGPVQGGGQTVAQMTFGQG